MKRRYGFKPTRDGGSKYHATKTVVDGITFDSKKEAQRYTELKLLERVGEISNLELQKPFELLPSQRDPETGKVVERAVYYRADFSYIEDGEQVIEDTKGMKTDVYILKRKLMLYKYGIRIKET